MVDLVLSSLLQRYVETQNDNAVYQLVRSESTVQSMTIGTGATLIASAVDAILNQLPSELIVVTCFWARSESLNSVVKLLSSLSKHAVLARKIVRVRICVSSLSIMQKALHTWSTNGRIYESHEWRSKLHLPFDPDGLPNLHLMVKSVFVPPICVMHSKFIITDKLCILPSCNVSWEDWFEWSVILRGQVVEEIYDYWDSFWGQGVFSLAQPSSVHAERAEDHPHTDGTAPSRPSDVNLGGLDTAQESPTTLVTLTSDSPNSTFPASINLSSKSVPSLLLPSSHHQNPRFRPLPWQTPASPPSTPLNDFQLHLFNNATSSIFIRTPNLTCKPVIAALLSATRRGVNVHILTNRKLMTLEQLVTAGTTTPRCVKHMQRQYESFTHSHAHQHGANDVLLEAGHSRLGTLKIEYYDDLARGTKLPVKAHIKLMIVDERVVVLGSGNQDRASWYTSQELGVAIESEDAARQIMQLAGRTPAEMLISQDSGEYLTTGLVI